MSSLHCHHHDRLLFIGDSITDAGRTNHCPPLGEGFVAMLDKELNQRYSELKLQLLNRGISGNTIEGLKLRWERDVLAEKPDWLFVYIGINDAHVTLNHSDTPAQRLKSFSDIYADLISKTNAKLPQTQIILLTPFLLAAEPESEISLLTSAYVKRVCDIGEQANLAIIYLQKLFDSVYKSQPTGHWSLDGVHPTQSGHNLIADALLKFLAL